MRLQALFTALFLAAASPAAALDGSRLRVIDGDTIVLPSGERVRLSDIDAPETRGARCPAERRAGEAARDRLAGMLHGRDVEIRRAGRDRWRRTLALVLVEGRSAGALLVAEGLALPWAPGPKARALRLAHWCGRHG